MREENREKTVSGILRSLMKSTRFSEEPSKDKPLSRSELTTLGVMLIRQDDGRFFINLTDVRVFSGISEFVQLLAGNVIQRSGASVADVLVEQGVDTQLTPELGALGITSVLIHVRSNLVRQLAGFETAFRRMLRLAFDAIQSPRWGGVLFSSAFGPRVAPEPGKARGAVPPALLFPFHVQPGSEDEEYYLLLEHDPEGRFLRVTVESAGESRLHLKRIPHRVLSDLDLRQSIQDPGRVAEQVFQGIHRESQNQQTAYMEIPGRQPSLFERLIVAGLRDLAHIKFQWPLEDSGLILFDENRNIVTLLSKVLMLFEDQRVIDALAGGNLVEMLSGETRVFLDLARAGACLNVCLFEERDAATIGEHLDRLPCLNAMVNDARDGLDGVRIVLIHHITSQILGFIRALDRLGCAFLETLFIKYKGVVPDRHLEALFTLPESRFRFHALQRVETRDSVEGCHILSKHYSPVEDLWAVEKSLRGRGLDYFQAMRLVAGHLFFKEAFLARKSGQLLLLIEDGGYMAPLLNRFCLEGKSLGESLAYFFVEADSGLEGYPSAEELEEPLDRWLREIFPGSVEHTRNGYDHLRDVERERGRLAFPACSIAISNLKNIEEARECSAALLHAVESIFHGMGHILSSRHVLVTGCRGNIGRNLMEDLSHRIAHGSLCGVDIVVNEPVERPMRSGTAGACLEVKRVEDLPEEALLGLDLVLGTVGCSVIGREVLEKLVLDGKRKAVFFASGSTKTVEFSDLSQWLQELLDSPAPTIGGRPVKIRFTPVKDPQTGLVQGNRVRFQFDPPVALGGHCELAHHKDLYLLGDLMPINFLYYGVPAEIIDEVLCQLLRLSLGFVKTAREGCPLPPRLLAVDHEIDGEARILAEPTEGGRGGF